MYWWSFSTSQTSALVLICASFPKFCSPPEFKIYVIWRLKVRGLKCEISFISSFVWEHYPWIHSYCPICGTEHPGNNHSNFNARLQACVSLFCWMLHIDQDQFWLTVECNTNYFQRYFFSAEFWWQHAKSKSFGVLGDTMTVNFVVSEPNFTKFSREWPTTALSIQAIPPSVKLPFTSCNILNKGDKIRLASCIQELRPVQFFVFSLCESVICIDWTQACA